MKKLTQAVFKYAPSWVKSAAVDRYGFARFYPCEASEIHPTNGDLPADFFFASVIIDNGYDTTDWQHSAIDREGVESYG